MKYWMSKISQWLKIKLRKWLFDEEYFMGADYGFHESAIVIIKRNRKTGVMEVIGENIKKDDYQQEFELRVRDLARRYSVPETNIARDFPSSAGRKYF